MIKTPTTKNLFLKLTLSLLPAFWFTVSYSYLGLFAKFALGSLMIYCGIVFSVWSFDNKNRLLARLFRYTELSFWLLLLTSLLSFFVLGSQISSSPEFQEGGPSVGAGFAIIWMLIVVVSWGVGIVGGLISHFLVKKYRS